MTDRNLGPGERNPVMTDRSRLISVILPVLNEAEGINDAIAGIYGQGPSDKVDVIVVDGDPRGSTVSAISDKRVITSVSERGRARQMNRGALLASGDILLFLHADTALPANALALIGAALEDPSLQAGAFDLGIRSERSLFRITEKYVALRTRLTRVPFGDQAIFIRKAYFKEIGGYCNIPLMEDVELMKRIRKRGDRISIIPDKVMTSPRRWEKEGVLFCTFRNWSLQMAFALGVPPKRLAKWYKPGSDNL